MEFNLQNTDDVESSTPLSAPTEELSAFEPFVRWVLSASLEEIMCHQAPLPTEAGQTNSDCSIDSTESAANHGCNGFANLCEAQLARADAEAQSEDIWDELSIIRRKWDKIDSKLVELREESEESKEQIALLEARIVKQLQDRDLAIAQKYTTEKRIREAEQFKTQQQGHQLVLGRTNSLISSLMRKGGSNATLYTEKDVERLQKEIADMKVESALAKTEQDTHYYRLRQIEKKCAAVKLEIAQSSALEDDLQALLLQLTRERRFSAEQLHQISTYSAAAAAVLKPSDPVFR